MTVRPLLFIVLLLCLALPLAADGHREHEESEHGGFFNRWFDGHGEHEKQESKHEFESSYINPVSDPTYAEECGACHFAYQAELLPRNSWTRLLEGLEDHFGEDATLAADQLGKVRAYLMGHAAETSTSARARKFFASADGQAPLRITELPYFKREHNEIPQRVIERPAVRRWSNCGACHMEAQKGIYSDEYVRIPQ